MVTKVKKYFGLGAMALALVPGVSYAQTVTVNPTLVSPNNTTTFNSLMTAINSFQTIGLVTAASPGGVGVNSGNPAPDVINIVSGLTGTVDEVVRIDERPASLGYAVLGEPLLIQGPGAGAAASAANNAYVALRDDGANDDDGFEIRTEQNITVKNVTFYPSLTTPPGDDMVTVDRINPSVPANKFIFQSCVFTTAKTGNLPVVNDKTEALVNNRAAIATPASAQDKLFSVFPDNNEAIDCDVIDCVFSHSIDNDAILEFSPRYTDASSTFALNIVSCVISHNSGAANRYGIQIAASGTANASRSKLKVSGANVSGGPVAGLGGPTVIIGNGRGIQSFAGNSTDASEHFAMEVSNTILADNVQRQISLDSNMETQISDVISSGPVPFVITSEANTGQQNWNRLTAVAGTAGSLFGTNGGSPNSLQLRDTIWAGNGSTAKAFDVFGTTTDLNINIDFSSIVLDGPHKVLAIGGTTNFTSGTATITDDPAFAGTNYLLSTFADVAACTYDNKGTGGTDLSGGASFVAICSRIREWLDY